MHDERAPGVAERPPLPTLIFLRQRTSGASRRMESLVAWVRVRRKKRLRVVDVDADANPEVVAQLGVRELPALVLVERGEIVGKLEGRARGQQIDDLIDQVVSR